MIPHAYPSIPMQSSHVVTASRDPVLFPTALNYKSSRWPHKRILLEQQLLFPWSHGWTLLVIQAKMWLVLSLIHNEMCATHLAGQTFHPEPKRTLPTRFSRSCTASCDTPLSSISIRRGFGSLSWASEHAPSGAFLVELGPRVIEGRWTSGLGDAMWRCGSWYQSCSKKWQTSCTAKG